MKAAIAIDEWKLSIFERRLTGNGYAFEKCPGLTEGTLILTVKTENIDALGVVIKEANSEAARHGGKKCKKPH